MLSSASSLPLISMHAVEGGALTRLSLEASPSSNSLTVKVPECWATTSLPL